MTSLPNQGAGDASFDAATAPRTSYSDLFYKAAWRWHFYAGLFVVPFMLTLATTGLIMLYFNSVESRWGPWQEVTPVGQILSVDDQAAFAAKAIAGGVVDQYIAPFDANHAGFFRVQAKGEATMLSVHPYTGEILNSVSVTGTWYNFANDIHGTLLIGDTGDRIMEIAAGLGLVLLATGLYLFWPRNGKSWRRVLVPNLMAKGRAFWKETHAAIGFWMSLVMVFFLISGLAWAGIWGGQFMQAWSTFPAEKWDNVPLSDTTHSSMNAGAEDAVAWGLEQTLMPRSGSDAGITGLPEGTPVTLHTVSVLANALVQEGYRLNLPGNADGVYTIVADAWDGETTDPTADLTIHVDQYTGKILAQVGYADYSVPAKAMAVSVALHQGDMGLWNTALNTLFCVSIIFLNVSGIIMWWKRRPRGSVRLAPPPMPANLPLWKGAVVIGLFLSLAFPLVGVTLLAALAFEFFILSRIPALKRAFA